MNTRTVIKGLKKQLALLESDKLDFNSVWAENTNTWLNIAFDEKDELVQKFNRILGSCTIQITQNPNDSYIHQPTKNAYMPIILSAIEKLKITGIKKQQYNFIKNLTDTQIIVYIIAIFLAGAALTEWIHKIVNEKIQSSSGSTNSNSNKVSDTKADITGH